MFLRALLLLMAVSCAALAASNPAAVAARRWREARERAIVDEFVALLSLPNVARELPDMRRNAVVLRQMLERRGIRNELLSVPDAPDAIYGEIVVPGATQTLMFYAHYDGQPVVAAQWKDSGPFAPVLRDKALEKGGKPIPLPAGRFDPESRLYARSAADDKAPILAMLTALDALRDAKIPLRSNIKFFFDGEEEAGSPHLSQIIEKYQSRLSADVWIFCDGPVHQSGRPQIVFGARGAMGLNMTIYGPKMELHSGHYGNWAPNPALMAARLVASLRDDEGRILIPGFYDDVEPLSDFEKQALAKIPDMAEALRGEFGLGRTEGGGKRLEELITQPALNIRGLAAATVGAQSANVIPTAATVSIDIRLVKGMDSKRALARLTEHVRAQGYFVTDRDPDDAMRAKYPKIVRIDAPGGYNAVRAPMDLAVSRKIVAAVQSAHDGVLLLPTFGGSLPIASIANIMKAPVIIIPIANHDDNQHSHNENIRLQNLWDGMETMASLLALQ